MIKRKKTIILITIICLIAICACGHFGVVGYIDSLIKFTINDTLADGGGKKVTVILLGGQSNASGCSRDDYLKQNVSSDKYAEYDSGYDNVYINYYVSDSYASNGFVKCATRQGEFGNCFGPELGMAEKLHQLYPNETFFIIKCAWGGTDLYSQWLSPSSGKKGELYRKFTKFVRISLEYLVSRNYDITIEGMCWMQGESDSFSVQNATDYQIHLSNFIKDIRNTYNRYAPDDGIAFIDACIANNPMYWVYCDLVNESKRKVEQLSPMNALIDTNAHGLKCDQEPVENPDVPHYDSTSQIKLGHLFIETLSQYFN